jgi:hypothetical protein
MTETRAPAQFSMVAAKWTDRLESNSRRLVTDAVRDRAARYGSPSAGAFVCRNVSGVGFEKPNNMVPA